MTGLPRFPACLAALAALAACVPRAAAPPPQPTPPPQPAPAAPTPAPELPPVAPTAWQDAPLASGDWSYSAAGAAPQAIFAMPSATLFALRCDAGGQIRMFRPGISGGPIVIVTSYGQRALPDAGIGGEAAATMAASDSLFDQIVFSRGRFLVRVTGGGDLVLPTWPEPARLIDDCRRQ